MIFKMKSLKQNNGFTLIELLVAVSIFAIVVMITMSVLVSMVKSSNKARMLNRIRDDGTRVMEDIEREVKSADEILVSSTDVSLNLRIDNSYTQYNIVLGTSDTNGYVEKKSNCPNTNFGNECTISTMTPTDADKGLNLTSDTTFTVNGSEVKIILDLTQPVSLPADKADYQASVRLESTVKTRSY